MARYIVRRVLSAIPVLLFISFMIYGILLIAPGGPEARFAQNPKITAAQVEAFRKRWGLDQAMPVQYCRWLGVCNPDNTGLAVFISDNGVPNFLPAAIGRRRQRHPPRRPRLLPAGRPAGDRGHRRADPADPDPGRDGVGHLAHDRHPRRHVRGRPQVRPVRLRAHGLQLHRVLAAHVLARDHAAGGLRLGAEDPASRRHVVHPRRADLRLARVLGLRRRPSRGRRSPTWART